MKQNKTKTVISNLFWRFMERIGAQGVTFIVSIILARLLDPEVYGTLALVTVLLSILQVFVDSGLGTALVQKKDADDIDFSSMFWFNIISSILLYICVFFLSPFIAQFYNRPELTPIIRVLSISLIIYGVKHIQQSYVTKNLLFKRFFFATLAGTIGAAIIGILFAYWGFGIWALVAQHLFNALIDTIVLWFTVRWRPHFVFSFDRLKKLFSYGWKLLIASLLETVYSEIRQLIIGKKYSSEDLAFYNRGKQFPDFIVKNINTSIKSVLLPVLAKEQDSRLRVKEMTRRSIKMSVYLIAPLIIGLAVCAESIVKLLLTEKWLPCVFFLRIYCFTFLFYPIHTANLSAIKALGRSDIFLKLEIIKKVIGTIAILTTMWISVEAMAYSLLFISISGQIINSWPNKRLMDYSYFEQIKDIFPSLSLSLIMALIVYPFKFLEMSDISILVIQVLLGGIVYLVGSIVSKNDCFYYIISVIKKMR